MVGIRIMHTLGIIGFGGMASYHLSQLRNNLSDIITVKGVYDVQETRQQAARDAGLVAYESADAMFADSEIDIVLIATPNDAHADYAIRAMRAGKNVMCEKPVTMSSEELKEVMKVRDETGKLFTINQNRRKDPDYIGIKNAIANDGVGELRQIESRVIGSRGLSYGWRHCKVTGGGIILDWGVHMIDQMMTMMPCKLSSLYCTMRFDTYKEVDDHFHLTLRFENGVNAIVEVATNNFFGKPRWYAACADGTIQVSDWGQPTVTVKPVDAEFVWADEIIQTKMGPSRTMLPRRQSEIETIETPLPDVINGVDHNYRCLVDAIEGKGALAVTAEEAMRTLVVIEKAFESAATGKAIEMNI